jgi:hypothetical protein
MHAAWPRPALALAGALGLVLCAGASAATPSPAALAPEASAVLSSDAPGIPWEIDAGGPSCLVRSTHIDGSDDRYEDHLCDAFRDTPHFRIHFATTGENMVYNWPSTEYVDSLGVYLEQIQHRCHDELDLPMVTSDGSRGGGEDLTDCYLLDITGPADGMASGEWLPGSGCPGVYTGYVVLRSTYRMPEFGIFLAGAAAHEYFHLIQYSVGGGGQWFSESTATWAESVIWPKSVQYAWRMIYWFRAPYVTLWNPGSSLFSYGSAHFWVMLETTLGSGFVAALLRRCCEQSWRAAMISEMEARGMTMSEALVRFALWNNATGVWNDGRHYPRGGAYPEMTCQKEYAILPVWGDTLPSKVLAREGGNDYIRFYGPGATDTLRIHFEGDAGLRDLRRISVAAQVRGQPQREWTKTPDEDGGAWFAIPGWSGCDQVTLIVTSLEGAGGNLAFRYSAWESGPPVPLQAGPVSVHPNPWGDHTHVLWETQGVSDAARIDLFDVGGRRVRSVDLGPLRPGKHQFEWDARDAAGVDLPSGVYYLRMRLGSEVRTARVVRAR